MLKEVILQHKLSFSDEDLIACKKGILSTSLIKKLQHRFVILISVSSFLTLFFLSSFCFVLLEKEKILNQLNKNSITVYYILIFTLLFFTALFIYVILINLKRYNTADTELISVIKANVNEIEYYISKNRSLTPYLKVKYLKFGPIKPIKNISEIFNPETSYLFYYSSKSKILLAVSEQKTL
ncbi:MAG: hypothetical protein ACPGSL_10800 [Vicingaceae bacterium]